jgi:hypothetical protein
MNFNCYKQGENPFLNFNSNFYKKSIALFWGVFLFLVAPSVLDAQTCSGNAGVVVAQTGVANPSNSLGAANSVAAELWDTGDQIVLDLTANLTKGTTIVARWKGNTSSIADPVVTVETSSDGVTFIAVTGSPYTVTRSATYFNQNITTPSSTRYVRITNTNTDNLDLDALTFTSQSCNVCSIDLSTNVSGCFDSNGNTTGGTNQAIVQAIVDWTNNPSGQTINVSCTGVTSQSINPATATKPTIINFTVPANGSTVTVTATFSTTTTCTATQIVTAPIGNCLLAPCVAGNTGGVVWQDFDSDGIKDAGETQNLSGVIVKAFDCNGNLVETKTTDYLGQYTFTSLTPSTTNKYRIEFSNVPPQYKATFNGTNGRTDVQFISAASCTVNFGVNNPSDYCQTNPTLAVPCYLNGNPLGGGNSGTADWLVAFPYNITNPTTPPIHLDGTVLGTVWGQAYQRQSKKLFSAAFVKRHSGLGTYSTDGSSGAGPISGTDSGSGGIYVTNFSSGTPVVSQFVNLQALGIETGDFATARNLPADKVTPNQDIAAYSKVGKMGLGDLDLSEDEQKLFVTNLFDRKIYQLTIGSIGTAPTSATALLNAPWLSGSPCNNGIARPFGLKVRNGKVYVGVVCTAENGGTSYDLSATVYEYDLAAGTWKTAINFPLSYKKGLSATYFLNSNKWNPWTDVLSNIPTLNNAAPNVLDASYPTPVLSDIEFDEKNNMILSFTDRTGDQIGSNNYGVYNTTNLYYYASGGEILKAGNVGNGQWLLESNGTTGGNTSTGVNNNQGPGGGEFFSNDFFSTFHEETTLGSLAYLMGSNEVALTAMDPVNLNSGGLAWFNSTTGAKEKGYELFVGVNTGNGTFGKANSLGDIELLCNAAPIQIGNYVWYDQDKDGVQDPCEQPLSNITVELWKSGTKIASITTNNSGEYYFSSKYLLGAAWTGTGADTSLLPSTAYQIRIDTTNQTRLDTVKLTSLNATTGGGNDQNDNDASISGNYAVITFTTGAAGSTNHTLDFGFYPCPYISNPSAAQTVCEGASGSNITVTTNQNSTNGIKFVKFTSDQIAGATPTAAELIAIYAGTAISSVTPTGASSPFTATYTWSSADFPNATTSPITYYVYTILNPDLGASCRPVQEIRVTINPLVVSGTASNVTLCNNSTNVIDLASLLTGEDAGGTWTRVSGTGGTFSAGAGSFTPSSVVTTSVFRYTVIGTSPCPNQTTDVTISFQNCCPSNNCGTISISKN